MKWRKREKENSKMYSCILNVSIATKFILKPKSTRITERKKIKWETFKRIRVYNISILTARHWRSTNSIGNYDYSLVRSAMVCELVVLLRLLLLLFIEHLKKTQNQWTNYLQSNENISMKTKLAIFPQTHTHTHTYEQLDLTSSSVLSSDSYIFYSNYGLNNNLDNVNRFWSVKWALPLLNEYAQWPPKHNGMWTTVEEEEEKNISYL